MEIKDYNKVFQEITTCTTVLVLERISSCDNAVIFPISSIFFL